MAVNDATASEVTKSTFQPNNQPAGLKWAWRVGPVGFYALVAVIFTWPLVMHLGDSVISPGRSGDVWQHLWNNWWMRFSLLDLHTHPYYTPTLLYPDGANLYFHALDPLDGYLSTPFQLLLGLVAAFNLNILFQLTLAGLGMYWLAFYLTGNRGGALVAGLIYACSPLESLFVGLGQLELSSIEWLPLYILCFMRALNDERRVWLWRSLSVAFLLALSFDSWYYVMYALLFSGLFFLYRLWQVRKDGRRAWLKTGLIAGGISLVYSILILPILLPTLHEAGAKGTTQDIFNVIYNSATLRGLFTTGPSLLWGVFGSSENDQFRGNFLGFITLGLALLGLIGRWRQGWFWGVVVAFFLLLAFGPIFHVTFEDWSPATANNGPQLPGYWLYKLPLGNISRVPLRFALITLLCLAILAAYGLAWLTTRLGRVRWTALALPALAGLLVLLEFLPGSRTLADASVSPFYSQLRNEGHWNDFAIMETPDRGNASIISPAMYYQSVHQHPIVSGYLSRRPQYDFQNYPGIRDLLDLDVTSFEPTDLFKQDIVRNSLYVLQYYKIRYVVVHPGLLSEADRAKAQALMQIVFGPTARPVYQDNQLQAWRVPDLDPKPTPDAGKVAVRLNGAWQRPAANPDGTLRTFQKEGRVNLFNPFSQPLTVQLQSETVKINAPLTARLNGQTVGQQAASGPLSLTLTLKPGLNELVLQSDGKVAVGPLNLSNK